MTQSLRLVLLRHGQSEWNADGIFTGWELQHRKIRTAELAPAAADRDWIPVCRSWRLNGRHYGALQGRRKDQVRREYGEHQFTAWRRSYDAAPPLGTAAARLQHDAPRYTMLPPDAQPRSESLRDVSARLLPYFYDALVPDLLVGGCVLVVSHGNTLRALDPAAAPERIT
jgi:2,3-bisphosphoglycerate-dependent phosphoglycerate mutase